MNALSIQKKKTVETSAVFFQHLSNDLKRTTEQIDRLKLLLGSSPCIVNWHQLHQLDMLNLRLIALQHETLASLQLIHFGLYETSDPDNRLTRFQMKTNAIKIATDLVIFRRQLFKEKRVKAML